MQFPPDFTASLFMALFIAGLLFIHLGLRNKASLAAFLSMVAVLGWNFWAHPVFHFVSGTEDPVGQLRMDSYSPHPVFDTVSGIVLFALNSLFILSFFLVAISISAKATIPAPRPGTLRVMARVSTRRLWALAMVSLAFSLAGALSHQFIAASGRYLAFALPSTITWLCGLGGGVWLVGMAIRRRFHPA